MKSEDTGRSISSVASEDSLSPSKCVTLGEIAASLREASRAKISVSPGKAPDFKASKADYSGRPLRLLAWFDQTSSSWRTCLPSLLEDSEPFSGRWPRSGIVSNGIAYPLPTLAHRTDVIESGLSESGMLWPTPRATEYKSPSMSIARREKGMAPEHLTGAVKMWPTPKAQVSGPDYARANRPTSGGDDLATSVARTMWPTPSATDWKGRSGAGHLERHGPKRISDALPLGAGQLNADWVSILMGYSLDWTSVEGGSAECQESPRGKKTEPNG